MFPAHPGVTMPYAPLYRPWSADAIDDVTTPGGAQGAPYPPGWWMPASAATSPPAGPQFAPPPQPASQTGATMPPAAPIPNDANAPPTAPASPPATSNGLPWWVMALLEPGGAPLARAPLVTPDWASTYSLLGRIGQLQHPLDPDGPPVDMNMSLFPRPPGSDVLPPPQPVQFNITHPQLGMSPSADAQPPSPLRSVLFNGAPPKSNTLPPDQAPDSDNSDRSTADLTVPNLPLSKFGTLFFPPPPDRVFSINPPSWLDVANSIAPNIVDYFTKPVPPQAPFPAIPGKIPTFDRNPYAGPALVDATNLATMFLPGAGIADSIADRIAMMGAKWLQSRAGAALPRGIAAIGREGEEAVGIAVNAPKPRIVITSSGTARFPDRLTDETIEDVKNVQRLSLTQQLADYLEYAQENGLTFILHTRPDTKYSGTLQRRIDTGQIKLRQIPRPPR